MTEDENAKALQAQDEEDKKRLEEQAAPVVEKLEETDSTEPVPMSDPVEASEELSPPPASGYTYEKDGNPNAY